MNEDKGYIMHCPRCGAEMNSNSRYCMKCGNLNYDHEANQGMKQYIKAGSSESYQVGSGKFLINEQNAASKEDIITAIANNTGSKAICFLVNIVLYVIIILLGFYLSVKDAPISVDLLKTSYFPFICVIVSLVFLYMYSMELLFIKCNKRWWSSLIPIYSNMVLGEIVFNNKFLGLLTLIPIIGQIIFLVMIYLLAKKLNYNGVLAVLFFPIFLIIMGFGNHLYEKHLFVDDNSNSSVEKGYKYKKIFLFISIPILLLGVVLIVRFNADYFKKGLKSINDAYYVYASKKMVNKTKDVIKNGHLVCPDYEYKKDSGVYYLYYADVSRYVYLPFHSFRDVISGYIKIDNTSGSSKYYVSISDGTYGFSETLIDDIKIDTVVEYGEITSLDSNEYNVCTREKSKYAR